MSGSVMLLLGGFERFTNPEIFTSSGTWYCPPGITSVNCLVVAGGGGGGGNGGGGAGGYRYVTSVSTIPGTTYSLSLIHI